MHQNPEPLCQSAPSESFLPLLRFPDVSAEEIKPTGVVIIPQKLLTEPHYCNRLKSHLLGDSRTLLSPRLATSQLLTYSHFRRKIIQVCCLILAFNQGCVVLIALG
ncbi:hypothetical protein NPIL_74741 [Nephila pilipes]|uniref:Uncharacterized protein n=1 Tax=Nephila pilipes TaxID=299642 RepID=A0A8X6NM65_NEPPI|nr:hypothetical protein NPIL_74741 [Nephila pilipes]